MCKIKKEKIGAVWYNKKANTQSTIQNIVGIMAHFRDGAIVPVNALLCQKTFVYIGYIDIRENER